MIFKFFEEKIFGGYWSIKQKYSSANKFFRQFYLLIHKFYQSETCSYLPMNAEIAGPINFPHGTYGIFISGDSRIGINCSIYQQVTIGSNALVDSRNFGSPIIGDNCLLGVGAKIIGAIKIGNNCRIGANCVVTETTPDNCTVVLNKPIVIEKKMPNNRIYTKTKKGWGYLENGKVLLETNTNTLILLNSYNS